MNWENESADSRILPTADNHEILPVNNRSKAVFAGLLHETETFLAIAAYFWLLIGLFTVFRAMTLGDEDILYHNGFSIVNALVLAKVVLAGEFFRLAENLHGRPLIYTIVFRSAVFAVLLMTFYIVEDLVIGAWKGGTIAESFPNFGGSGGRGVAVVSVIVFLGLIPFFSYVELAKAIGPKRLNALIFKTGTLPESFDVR